MGIEKTDMSVPCGGGIINIRAGAIIVKNGKMLMVKSDAAEYYYSVGGRLKMGETAAEAVVREVYEETGVKMDIDRLAFIHENYFVGESEKKRGLPIYEISFYYFMKVPDGFAPLCDSVTEDGHTEELCWISPDEPTRYYPEFLRTELSHPSENVKFFSTDDR